MEHDKKTVTIIVDGTPHEWPKGEITYAEVVTLEVPDYAQHPEITYSVKYKNGHGEKPEGVLAPNGSVKVKDGEIFHGCGHRPVINCFNNYLLIMMIYGASSRRGTRSHSTAIT